MEVLYIILSISFYVSALNSGPNALPFVFILPFFTPYWWLFLIPLVRFLRGRRWRTSLIKRKWKHKNLNLDTGFKWSHIINVPKVLGYYIYLSVMPINLGFFHSWGVQTKYFKPITLIACGILCVEFLTIGLYLDYKMVFWWFFSIGIFTHLFGVKGQYIAERYLLLSNVAFCVLMTKFLTNPLYTIVCTLYFTKSLSYIKSWRCNESLFRDSMLSQPDTPENFNNLANLYIDRGQIPNAVAPLQVAEHIMTQTEYDGEVLRPTNNANLFNVYISLAKCYYATRHYLKAKIYAQKALKNPPKNQVDKVQHLLNEIHNKIITLKKNEKYLKKKGIIT